MNKTYTIERRMISVKKSWFRQERKPMWCLVEHGTYVDYSDRWFDTFDYNTVILHSEDKEYIEQELLNFRGEC